MNNALVGESSGSVLSRKTILLVEDDPSLRKLIRTMLEVLGQDVLTAENAATAIHMVETHPGDIHLVMTDLMLPDFNGRELIQRLFSLRPALKVLLISGHSIDVATAGLEGQEPVAFLQKPIKTAALKEALSNIFTDDGGASQPDPS
jgi:CheY-like chemotaxis protein